VAKAVIEASQCADYYVLEEVNIEKEPELLERYKNDVPVITINGVEAFRHRLKSEDFRLRILGHQESAT